MGREPSHFFLRTRHSEHAVLAPMARRLAGAAVPFVSEGWLAELGSEADLSRSVRALALAAAGSSGR